MNSEKCLGLLDAKIKEILESDSFKVARDKDELSSTLKCRCLLKGWFDDHEPPTTETQAPSEFRQIFLDAEDEMSASKKYLDMYTDSDDAELKTMAQDELRHAAKLIKLGVSKATSAQEKNEIAKLNAKYQLLAQKLT